MSTRIVLISLFSVALFSSYSSAIAADIRPEVARPLDDARVMVNGWSARAAIMAKLDQAASVPNLSKEEQAKIRATTIYALGRFHHESANWTQRGAPQREMTPQSSINSGWPYR